MADTQPAPPDALSLLSAALSAQDAETEQRSLRQLLALFQSQPGNIPPLFPSLVSMLPRASEALRKWIVDVIDLTFNKPTLGPQARTSLAVYMPEPILALLNEMDLRHAKVAISAFASIYQPLFRIVCTDRSQARLWPMLESIKQRIVQLFDVPQYIGVKLAVLKAYQKIILVQTRAGGSGAASKSAADANVAQIPPDHPMLKAAPLEQEANERLTQVVTVIFTSSSPDLVMAAMNSMATLAKLRPSLSPIVFEALISWTPSALASAPYMTIRSVEKTVRLLYQHFHPNRNSLAGPYAAQIIEALDTQKMRMETAAREEEAKKGKQATSLKRPAPQQTKATGEDAMGGSAAKRKRVRFAEMDGQDSEHSTPALAVPESTDMLGIAPLDAATPTQLSGAAANLGDPMRLADDDPNNPNPMAAFDVSTLPLHLVIDLVMANLEAIAEPNLLQAISLARARVNGEPPLPPRAVPVLAQRAPTPPPRGISVKEEDDDLDTKPGGLQTEDDAPDGIAQDPLKIDMGDEETLDAAERHLEETAAHDGDVGQGRDFGLASFALRPPSDLSEKDCKALMQASVDRICQIGSKEHAIMERASEGSLSNSDGQVVPSAQLWTTLVVRLATRGFFEYNGVVAAPTNEDSAVTLRSQSESIRALMLEFVAADFPQRIEFALQWMAEEFRCLLTLRKQGKIEDDQQSSYAIWLQKITAAVIEKMDSKDKTLHEFLNRVPLLTSSIISTLQALCLDKTKMAAGFTMLRDLAIHRAPARDITCSILLALARNEEKMVRGAAILTVRNWVRINGQGKSPAGEKVETEVMEFAKAGLYRLTVRQAGGINGAATEVASIEAAKEKKVIKGENGSNAEAVEGDEEGEEEEEVAAQPSALDDPEAEIHLDSDVIRLVELPFALCVRVGGMLDEIFEAYTKMSPQVQNSVEKNITPLIKSLGPHNEKLISLVQSHPAGSDSLAVHVYMTMSEKQRSKKLVDLVKQMAEENASEVDPRFLIPILPDLEKAEIIKYLPRVVSILASEKPEDRTTIRNVFLSIVQPPEQGFGSVSSNLPRVRQSELLSPVELMTLLHHTEPEIGRKTAAEAIRICFGMTDIYRSEILGAVLNQLVEEPVLPVLFMRTAIMAVRTYKSLSSYISTIFLSRLITKKVWQQPLLWDGFVICAKQTAPASFGALIQLPREQLRDVVSRQPDLRTGLREYLVKKAAGNKARLKSFSDLLDDGNDGDEGASAAAFGTPGSGTSTPQHIPTTVEGA